MGGWGWGGGEEVKRERERERKRERKREKEKERERERAEGEGETEDAAHAVRARFVAPEVFRDVDDSLWPRLHKAHVGGGECRRRGTGD